MQLEKASRKRAKIKMAIQGPSGSGKTHGALLLAFGLCGDWSKIAVIDTENRSAELYSDLGSYNTINVTAPFTPEKYIEALCICEKAGIEVIIIDSISHEWDGTGGILETHSNMVGNSFTNWSKLTPRHNAFIQAILQSPCHVIGTIRSKQDYVLSEKNGRMVPEKVGLKGVTREGMDYEFTLVFDLDIKHNASSSKDRTKLFASRPDFKLTAEIGREIQRWCSSPPAEEIDLLENRINRCASIQELLELFEKQAPEIKEKHALLFSKKRSELPMNIHNSFTTKHTSNGIPNNAVSKK